jgi:hypothetical protein
MTNTTSPPAIAAVSPPAALNTLSSSICSGVIASACLAPSSFRGGLYGVADGRDGEGVGGASFAAVVLSHRVRRAASRHARRSIARA